MEITALAFGPYSLIKPETQINILKFKCKFKNLKETLKI